MKMEDIKGKKLMVFGGMAQQVELIKRAMSRGAYVICVDYVEDSPGKKIANEGYNISIKDVDKVVELAKEKKVDGVMNYCIDPGQIPYLETCSRLELPCYGNKKQFEALTQKDLFNYACSVNDINVINSLEISQESSLDNQIKFPLVIKPVDGRASRGFSIVKSKTNLKSAIDNALSHSDVKKVLVQEYIKSDELCAKYYVNDGSVYLTSISDTQAYFVGIDRVCINSKIYPSKHAEEFIEKIHPNVLKLVEHLGIKNGPLSFTAFYCNGEFKFFDPSFRLGGGEEWRLISHITGVDLTDALTTFALRGKVSQDFFNGLDCGFMKKFSVTQFLLADLGKIKHVIENGILGNLKTLIGYHYTKKSGDEIKNYGTVDHVVGRFFFSADKKEKVINDVEKLSSTLRVIDINDRDITLPFFDIGSYR